jgi:hypothetical protein
MLQDFWSKVDVRGSKDCWLCLGYKSKDHGKIKSDRTDFSHRIALHSAAAHPPHDKPYACHRST